MIRAVLFDMNGIIIDDEQVHEAAFRETLQPHGIELTHQLYLECCAGRTDGAGYEAIGHKLAESLPVDELLRKKHAAYFELLPQNKKAHSGVVELIRRLQGDFRLAITSSSSRSEVDLVTREFGIRQYFETTISANDVIRGKPDPEPYLLTASLLKLEPSECAVIEDSKNGVTSAVAAGCHCIGITTTHDKEALSQADLVVGKFDEITLEVIMELTR